MIRYTLSCANGHRTESWFRNADTFDSLRAAGQVACPDCGTTDVDKGLMAPRIATGGTQDTAPSPAPADAGTPPGAPSPEALRAAIEVLRAHVEATSEDVGRRFATEARAIHEGTAPERPIYGEARPEEARALIEDGIPVAPLPFIPRKRTN